MFFRVTLCNSCGDGKLVEVSANFVNYFDPISVNKLSIEILIQLEVVIMKKYFGAAALVGVISFVSFSMVNAHGNYGYGPGPGYGNCNGYNYCENAAYYDQDNEKTPAFLEETKETRKAIFIKRSELDALMNQDNPDEKKVAKLTSEIYDLQTLMVEKSNKTFGDSPRYGYGPSRRGYGNCGRVPYGSN
jgi:hypothetical protein